MKTSPSDQVKNILRSSNIAKSNLATLKTEQKNDILLSIAEQIRTDRQRILQANGQDMQNAKGSLSESLLDRLELNDARIDEMSTACNEVAALVDPVGIVLQGKNLRGGVELIKKRTPLGTVLVIYESRPNVTVDISALCLKSGNAAILKGGKEANHSNVALGQSIEKGIQKIANEKLQGAVQLVTDYSREVVASLLTKDKDIDIVVPRGGKELIQHIKQNSTIPVIAHDEGICHLYIDKEANSEMASTVTLNAKTQRPGVCNTIETLVIHKDFSQKRELLNGLSDAGVELRLDDNLSNLSPKGNTKAATSKDWDTEYHDMIISVKQVNSLKEAIHFVNSHSSGHTDGIITNNLIRAKQFEQEVDTSCIAINVSTRYHDGSMFGMGGEVGTSTQKLHVRGTMVLEDLTTTKFVLTGNGQIRT